MNMRAIDHVDQKVQILTVPSQRFCAISHCSWIIMVIVRFSRLKAALFLDFAHVSGFAEVRSEIDAVPVQLSICEAVIEALLNDQLGLVIRCSMQMPGPKNNFSPHLRSRIMIVTLVTWPTVHKRPREGTDHRERGTQDPGHALSTPPLSLSRYGPSIYR